MQLKPIIVGSVCAIATCVANADEYIWAGFDLNEGYLDWVHKESILNLDNGNTSFYVYSANVNPKLPYDLKITELEIRCKSRELKTIETVTFLKEVKKNTKRVNSKWWRIRPHSAEDSWRKLVCDEKTRDGAYQQTYQQEGDLVIASQLTLRYFQKEEAERKKASVSKQ